MEDSLELSKLSAKRKSVSPSAKDEKEKALFQQVKQKFITALLKLQSSQTRQIGIQEIRTIVDQNREPDHLRLYLSVMKTLKIEGTSSSTKEHEILVFSILAEFYKENLVDPIDKPAPSRIKTCFKIIQILHSYFKQTTNTVQQACARVLIDLGKHVLGIESPKCTVDTQTLANLLFSPLGSILKSGVDKASQSTASVCINEQIQYWKSHLAVPKYSEMLDYVCPEMLAVALKLNCQYHEIFMALQTMIQLKGLQFFDSKLVQFVSKILGVINKINQKSPQDAGNFNTYMCKVNVCGILAKIGELIKDNPSLKTKLDELDVLPSLEKATRNRVIQVQMAAARAIRSWNGQSETNGPRDKKPSSTPKMSNKGQLMSLQEARNNKKRERSGSKQQKLKLERELNHMQEDLQKLVKGGWGPHNRANNYVKKNTGVGGGYCSKMEESPSPKLKKSHKQHIDELRKYIKQNSKEHGKKDKFVFYEERQKNGLSRNNKRIQQSSELPIASHKKKENPYSNSKAQEDEMEFVLDESQGDQMVNLPRDEKNKNPYAQYKFSGELDTEDQQWLSENKNALKRINSEHLDGIIDQQEMKQLLKEEKNILGTQSKPYIESMLNTPQINDEAPVQIKKQGVRYGEMTFNVKQDPQKISKINKSKPDQLKENQKKRKCLDDGEMVNEEDKQNIYPQTKNTKNSQKNLSDEEQKQRTEEAQNFKVTQPNNNRYWMSESVDGSESMSASIPIGQIMNESDFEGLQWNPFRLQTNKIPAQNQSKEERGERGDRRGNEKLSGFGKTKIEDTVKDSLVLSLSRQEESKSRSPSKNMGPKLTQSKKSEVTLNPAEKGRQFENNKFNSFSQRKEEDEEQILDESKYEDLIPASKPDRGSSGVKVQDYYKITMKHGQQLDRRAKQHPDPQRKSEVYQQMIKYPPKTYLNHDSYQPSEQSSGEPGEQSEQQNGNHLTDSWERVLELLENNQVNDAYSLVLAMDDPIYLLRLMLMTQTPLGKLTPANTCALWEKFLEIYKHRFIDNLFVQLFSSAQKIGGSRGVAANLSIQELNELLIELYELSGRTKGQLSFKAASLYNEVEETTNKKRSTA